MSCLIINIYFSIYKHLIVHVFIYKFISEYGISSLGLVHVYVPSMLAEPFLAVFLLLFC